MAEWECPLTLNWLIEIAGHLEGLSTTQLDQIDAAMPATKKVIDLIGEAKPLITKAEPIINEALKEWTIVAPTIMNLINKFGIDTNKHKT